MVLGLSVFALPALATPSHPMHSHEKSLTSASRSARPMDVDLRIDAKKAETFERGSFVRASRYERAKDGMDWKSPWNASPAPGDPGAFVPEPSAVTLFGVGVVVALQAIPRRSSRTGASGESGGAAQHG